MKAKISNRVVEMRKTEFGRKDLKQLIAKRRLDSNTKQQPQGDLAEMLGIMDKDKDVKVISSEFHTLFVEDDSMSPGQLIIPMEVISQLVGDTKDTAFDLNSLGESIQLDAPEIKYKKYTLFIGDFMQPENTKEGYYKLLKEFSKVQPEDTIVIHVSSNGGSIDEGIQVMKHITTNFTKENITTILDPHGYSMGSFMFLIGNQRIVSQESSIMLHNYSMGAFGKGGEIKDYVDFTDVRFSKLAHKVYVEAGYLTQEEFDKYKLGKEWWFDCEDMATRGIATHVMTDTGEIVESPTYMEIVVGLDEETKPKKKPAKKKPSVKKAPSKKPTPKKKTSTKKK